VIALVKEFMHSKKPVASICHGQQILAAAGVLKVILCCLARNVVYFLHITHLEYVQMQLIYCCVCTCLCLLEKLPQLNIQGDMEMLKH